MTWQPVHPPWTAVDARQIDDLHWLGYAVHRDLDSPYGAGIASTLGWVRGGRVAPVTERDEMPVTRDFATAEMWAAAAASTPDVPPPPLESICADLAVTYWSPLPVVPRFADGTWKTLRWLLGMPGQQIPLPAPQRHDNGTVVSADELYDRAVADTPWKFRLREQQIELRNWVEKEARQSEKLAATIAQARTLAAS